MPMRHGVFRLLFGLVTGVVSVSGASGEATPSVLPPASSSPSRDWQELTSTIEASPITDVRVIIGTADGILTDRP